MVSIKDVNQVISIITFLISFQYGLRSAECYSGRSSNIIFKCCNKDSETTTVASEVADTSGILAGGGLSNLNSNNNLILLSDYYLLPLNNHSDEGEAQDKRSPKEVYKCHNDENLLSRIFSVYPNSSDEGFLDNGYLLYDGEYFSSNQYCVEAIGEVQISLKALPKQFCSKGGNCLRKCCEPLEVYDLSTYGKSRLQCVPTIESPWVPELYNVETQIQEESFNKSLRSFVNFMSNHPKNWCTDDNVVIWSLRPMGIDRKSLFRILSNGTVVKKKGVHWESMNTSKICIDGAINIPGNFNLSQMETYYSGDLLDTIILECGPTLSKTTEPPLVLYGVAIGFSSVFLLATMIIYALLWDKQNLHGWTLLGYVTTELLFYSSLISIFFYLYQYPDLDFTTEAEIFSSFCGVIAVISHFLYISSTCWLTVISFDIFSKFRILKLTRARSKTRLKFLIYLIFTLIVPTIIVSTGVLLDITYGDDVEVNMILPRYGWNKCFLDLKNAGMPYLFGPIGVLLGVNCFLYLATIFSMHKLQESTKFANANNRQVQKQRGKIRLFTKLFLLMGISWIFDVISYVVYGANANIPIIIGDMINILQPVLIFVIFVCKKDILRSLCKKYSPLAKFFSSVEADENVASTASTSSKGPMLSRFLNPIATTNKWFRSRLNSTTTDTSNISNQSIRSTLDGIDETPVPSSVINPSSLSTEKC